MYSLREQLMQVFGCILKAVCRMSAVYEIVCGLKRHLVDKNGDQALNPLHAHDKRYGKLSTLFLLVWYYLFREQFHFLFKVTCSCLWINYNRFGIFRRALGAEMKDAIKEGLHVKCQKEEKEFFTAEEERKFWEIDVLGTSSAESLYKNYSVFLRCIFTINFFI